MNRRIPILVIIVGLVVGALVLDGGRSADTVVVADESIDASEFPISARSGALSSTWFCAGGSADDDRFADHVVTMLNPSDAPMEVTLTVFAGVVAAPAVSVDPDSLDGEETTTTTAEAATTTTGAQVDETAPVVEVVQLAPRTRERVRLADVVTAPVASALVEATVGGLVVEHEVSSVHGIDAKPCATAAATSWHFAWGATTVDARELLVLFNPFPDDAIVDGRFSTEDGIREPGRFDGLVVPGRGTLAIDLGDDVTRRQEVAATITARAGRIVVDRIIRFDGEEGVRGLTVQSGIPEPQDVWVYPDGFVSEEVREQYVVYNPGESLAEVELTLQLDDPDTNGVPEPVDLSLAPGTHQVVDLAADELVPAGIAHSAVVRSANGVPIVAERVLKSEGSSRNGVSVTTGSPVESERWAFAAGATNDSSDEWLVLVNLDPQILAEVEVTAVAAGQLVPVADLQAISLEAGSRLAIRLGEKISRDDLSIVVTSSEPIVVERGLYRVGADQRGMSNAVGVPAPEGLRIPADPLDATLDVDVGDDPLTSTPDEDEIPTAPDDVELPEPDETIVVDDPDAEAETPTSSTTSSPPTTAPGDGVPETAPG